MNNPAFLVEGEMEQKFLQNACPKSPVRRIGVNGDSVSINAIAKRVGTQARLLGKRNSPIVILFDRERRKESCDSLLQELTSLLDNEDIGVAVIVGIADRDIESWILADKEAVASHFGIPIETIINLTPEGSEGKGKLKGVLPSGMGYCETIDGVTLLKACRPYEMRRHSSSFKNFLEKIAHLNCWWLQKQETLSF